MGIFSRLGTLIKSNLNDLVSKAEDPEKMLQQVMLEMQKQLIESKKQVAMAIADEKRLQKQLDQELEKGKEWERKAILAVKTGDDELAKGALLRKKDHDEIAAQYQQQWMGQKAAVDKLKEALRLLTGKIEEARRKKNILIARKKRAEAQKTIADTMSGLSENSAFDTFDRMTHKIDQLEAEASAGAEIAELSAGDDSLESRFAELEKSGVDPDMDFALSELKSKLGLAAPNTKPQQQLPAPATKMTAEDLQELEDMDLDALKAAAAAEDDEAAAAEKADAPKGSGGKGR